MNVTEIANSIEDVLFWIDGLEIPNYAFFVLFVLLSIIIGRYTPGIVGAIVHRFLPRQAIAVYDNTIDPVRSPLKVAGTFILIQLSLVWLDEYRALHEFIEPFFALATVASVAWLASQIVRQLVRVYAIEILERMGVEIDEMVLVFETFANIFIGFVAVFAYAQSQNLNLLGLFASVGLGGLAVAFAAQKILEQVLSTIVLYLDRPFVPGDYIRLSNGELGRIESIGLRSTKIRTAAKSTLFIVPNSNLVGMEIENLTRAKKVMVLLYLDFLTILVESDRALVQQTIVESTNSVFGIDPGSTNVTFNDRDVPPHTQARITFFILGSSENSIQLRKRLLELANDTISLKLKNFGIEFTSQDPTVYVESPITL